MLYVTTATSYSFIHPKLIGTIYGPHLLRIEDNREQRGKRNVVWPKIIMDSNGEQSSSLAAGKVVVTPPRLLLFHLRGPPRSTRISTTLQRNRPSSPSPAFAVSRNSFLLPLPFLLLLLLLDVAALSSSSSSVSSSRHPAVVSPTALRVFDINTGEVADALSNPLYDELLGASFSVPPEPPLYYGDDDDAEEHRTKAEVALRKGRLLRTETVGTPPGVYEPPSLSPDRRYLSAGNALTLTVRAGSGDDVLALYCPHGSIDHRGGFRDAATVAQVVRVKNSPRRRERPDTRPSGGAAAEEDEDEDEERAGGGAVVEGEWRIPSFPVVREDTCEFRLWSRLRSDLGGTVNASSFELSARTGPLFLRDARRRPTAVRLSLTSDPFSIAVMFTTGDSGTPVAEYGPVSNGAGRGWRDGLPLKATGTSDTYSASDLCQSPANSTDPGRFVDPGMLHTVLLPGLEPDVAYGYQVGLASGQGIVWSDMRRFQSAPPVGPSSGAFTFLAYGDQGVPTSGEHMGGQRTTDMVVAELDAANNNATQSGAAGHSLPLRAVHHIGDLSYARGAAHLWDDWHLMVEPFASRVPLMVGVGNHEYDHTAGGEGGRDPSGVNASGGFMPPWGNFGSDSGGECGVPYSKRFAAPTNGNGAFWYSYAIGSVHTVVISSEHDLGPRSSQHRWLKSDLGNVNRTLTPWLIVESHRPMYHSEAYWLDNDVSIGMRYEFEDLLHQYKVDVFLAGHYHSYLRTCDGLYRGRCGQGGPTHITVGTAGATLDSGGLYRQNWTETFLLEWGYGRATVFNDTALRWQFAAVDGNGTLRDEVWIRRLR